jgi:hypothetical protein
MGTFQEEWARIEAQYEMKDPQSDIERLRMLAQEHPLICYGAGKEGAEIADKCEKHKIPIRCFVDNYKTGLLKGYPIISAGELKLKYAQEIVCITSSEFSEEIETSLLNSGFAENQIQPSLQPYFWNLPYAEFTSQYLSGYAWAYDFFGDTTSKHMILDRISMYLLGSAGGRTSYAPQYFEPGIIELSKDEVFVDGGGYTGDTAAEFMKQVKNVNGGGVSLRI